MFYFFSKTINYVATPAGCLLVLMLFAYFTKNNHYRRRLAGGILGLFWLFGNSFLINELALWWEYPIQSIKTNAPADSTCRTAVILTGGMTNSMKEIPVLSQGRSQYSRFLLGREADRAGQALYLYKTGIVQKILISGGSSDTTFMVKNIYDEGQMIAHFLQVAGVRTDDIILENQSRNTHENAHFTALMLRERFHGARCVLITSAFHMRRAIGCFEKEGVVVTPYPASFISNQRLFMPGEWLLPSEEAFFEAYYLAKELVGYTVYKAMGYL